jgi:hypothetical protein
MGWLQAADVKISLRSVRTHEEPDRTISVSGDDRDGYEIQVLVVTDPIRSVSYPAELTGRHKM